MELVVARERGRKKEEEGAGMSSSRNRNALIKKGTVPHLLRFTFPLPTVSPIEGLIGGCWKGGEVWFYVNYSTLTGHFGRGCFFRFRLTFLCPTRDTYPSAHACQARNWGKCVRRLRLSLLQLPQKQPDGRNRQIRHGKGAKKRRRKTNGSGRYARTWKKDQIKKRTACFYCGCKMGKGILERQKMTPGLICGRVKNVQIFSCGDLRPQKKEDICLAANVDF
jgi:hypothetical protein